MSSASTPEDLDGSSPRLKRVAARRARQTMLEQKAEELSSLIVAFVFALQ